MAFARLNELNSMNHLTDSFPITNSWNDNLIKNSHIRQTFDNLLILLRWSRFTILHVTIQERQKKMYTKKKYQLTFIKFGDKDIYQMEWQCSEKGQFSPSNSYTYDTYNQLKIKYTTTLVLGTTQVTSDNKGNPFSLADPIRSAFNLSQCSQYHNFILQIKTVFFLNWGYQSEVWHKADGHTRGKKE